MIFRTVLVLGTIISSSHSIHDNDRSRDIRSQRNAMTNANRVKSVTVVGAMGIACTSALVFGIRRWSRCHRANDDNNNTTTKNGDIESNSQLLDRRDTDNSMDGESRLECGNFRMYGDEGVFRYKRRDMTMVVVDRETMRTYCQVVMMNMGRPSWTMIERLFGALKMKMTPVRRRLQFDTSVMEYKVEAIAPVRFVPFMITRRSDTKYDAELLRRLRRHLQESFDQRHIYYIQNE